MKQISIIIPIHQEIDSSDSIFEPNKIINSFLLIDRDLRTQGIEYEIILVATSTSDISLDAIEIFPLSVPIRLYKVEKTKQISDLIIKGISYSRYEYICVLGDPSQQLAQMFKAVLHTIKNTKDVIVSLKTRPSFVLPFFFKMRINPQNVLLFFPKQVWNIIHFKPANDSVFLLEFLKRSEEAGFTCRKDEIISYSSSLFKYSRNSFKELFSAVKDLLQLRTMKIPPVYVYAQDQKSMKNAGIFYKKHQYITHTTLPQTESASEVFSERQTLINVLFIEVIVVGFLLKPLLLFQVMIGILSIVYFSDVLFNFYLVCKTLRKSYEVVFTPDELNALEDEKLPVYTILCPLYKEAHMIEPFLQGIAKLEWPRDKLDVMLLLEEDDKESINAVARMHLPTFVQTVIIPNSKPKTKPKACNYGLAYAKGEYMVIYDAEDIPDPLQLKKAYRGFNKLNRKVVCLQAKLNYYNTNQNLLTRFFTAEYSLWFDVSLAGLQSINTSIPLGGTSNHFRTSDIKSLRGWDPFNVAEDADLGMRLFKLGYRTAIIDSVTLEEANSQVKNWLRQRSRWIKGYMQTFLVHTRDFPFLVRQCGIHVIFFYLVIGGRIAFTFINPLMWLITLSYFILPQIVGPTIQALYPPFILYIAISSLIFGNYFYLFSYIIGCVKKEQWSLIKYIYLIPLYWLLISIAGWIALYQLFFKPHYWEKTVHGLHLTKKNKQNNFSVIPAVRTTL